MDCSASTTVDFYPSSDAGESSQDIAGNAGEPASGAGSAGELQDNGGGGGRPACPDGSVSLDSTSHQLGLLHRYDFSEPTEWVCDGAGTAHGRIHGATFNPDSGRLGLDGVDDFVELPPGMVSNLDQGTLVAWFVWNGGRDWERVFDFGTTTAGDQVPGESAGHFFLTPRYNPGPGPSVNLSPNGGSMLATNGNEPLSLGELHQLAVIINGEAGGLEAMVDGVSMGEPWGEPIDLSGLDDDNGWLGQSQWSHDPHFLGEYDDFRIYGRALTASEIEQLVAAGPDGGL